MTIPTEPIGVIPRSSWWLEAFATTEGTDPKLTCPRVLGTALASDELGVG